MMKKNHSLKHCSLAVSFFGIYVEKGFVAAEHTREVFLFSREKYLHRMVSVASLKIPTNVLDMRKKKRKKYTISRG